MDQEERGWFSGAAHPWEPSAWRFDPTRLFRLLPQSDPEADPAVPLDAQPLRTRPLLHDRRRRYLCAHAQPGELPAGHEKQGRHGLLDWPSAQRGAANPQQRQQVLCALWDVPVVDVPWLHSRGCVCRLQGCSWQNLPSHADPECLYLHRRCVHGHLR